MSWRARLALSLVILLALPGCAPAASSPPAASPPAAGAAATSASEPSPSPTPAGPVISQPEAQPAPAITEPRAIELEWPLSVRVGNSDLIRLSLVARPDGYLTPTAEVSGHEVSGTLIEIPNLYDTHDVAAIARLDSVGFEIDRVGDWEQPLQPGASPRWQWTITPRQAGQQVATLTLRLRFTPKGGGENLEREIWNRALTINTATVLGFTGPVAQTLGAFGSLVGAMLGFPFSDKVLGWVWGRLRGKRRRA